MVVAPPLLREIDLEVVFNPVDLNGAIEEAGFLRMFWP